MFEEMKWQKWLIRPSHLLGSADRLSTDADFAGLVGRFTEMFAHPDHCGQRGHVPAQRPPDLHRHGDGLPRRLPDVLLPGPRHPPRLLFRPRTLTGHQLGRAVLNLTFFFFFVVLSRLQGRDAAERDPVVDPQRPFHHPDDLIYMFFIIGYIFFERRFPHPSGRRRSSDGFCPVSLSVF